MEPAVKSEVTEGEVICVVIGIPIQNNQEVDDCSTWIYASYKPNTIS